MEELIYVELKRLCVIKAKYDALINAIEAAAQLGYRDSCLSFNEDIIDAVFMAIEPDRREETLIALKAAKDKKGGDQA